MARPLAIAFKYPRDDLTSMRDHLVTYLTFIPISIILLLMITVVVVNWGDDEPSNPVGEIPKVVLDHQNDEVIVTVVYFGNHIYDAIYINYTVGVEKFNVSAHTRYVLDANISAPFFTLNITVLSGPDHYMFNSTVQVEYKSGDVRLLVQEEGQDKASDHSTPYTILAEWRDME